jgi:hypothetical protein
VEVVVLEQPDGVVIGRGSYYGGPDCKFVVASDGQVYFHAVGATDRVWAGPDPNRAAESPQRGIATKTRCEVCLRRRPHLNG